MTDIPSILIRTSGYTYSWNKWKSNKFEWYINQDFNSVAINGSLRFSEDSSILIIMIAWFDYKLMISKTRVGKFLSNFEFLLL